MSEYDVSFYSNPDGLLLIDIHGSSGTTPYMTFHSMDEVRELFQSLGLADDKLAEVEAICSNLKPGHGYHERMFLPESVHDAILKSTGDEAAAA